MRRTFAIMFKKASAAFLSASLLSGCVALAAGAAAGGAGGAVSSARASEGGHHSPAVYLLTVASNVAYFPAKVVFAGVGAVGSGLTYAASMGDSGLTRNVWNASVLGTYLVQPNMIEGNERVRFIGP